MRSRRSPTAWLLFSATLARGRALSRGIANANLDQAEEMVLPRIPVIGFSKQEQSNVAPIPTWMDPFQRRECTRRRAMDMYSDHPMYCNPNATLVYSPQLKLAYVCNQMAAETSWLRMFTRKFSDTIRLDTSDPFWIEKVPTDTFFFTFVRDPRAKQLHGYAEVDYQRTRGQALESFRRKARKPTEVITYPAVSRRENGGVDRYLAFLEDLLVGRIPSSQSWYSAKAANSQIANLCVHPMHFVGHLESVTEHWDIIQSLAKVPAMNRTSATLHHRHPNPVETPTEIIGNADLPEDYVDIDEHMIAMSSGSLDFTEDVYDEGTEGAPIGVSQRYQMDMTVDRSVEFNRRFCEVYYADFVCLGYELPQACQKALSQANTKGDVHPFITSMVGK